MIRDSQESSGSSLRRVASRLLQTDLPHQSFLDATADIADGYYECDFKGRLTTVNASFCRILGCAEAAQVINGDPRRFLDESAQERIRQALHGVRETGTPAPSVECTITRADGESRILEFSISLLRGSTDQPVGFRGIVRDVTERIRAASLTDNRHIESVHDAARLYETLQAQFAELSSLYSQVSDMEQLKTHLIRVAAHDLRNPLSVIATYIELLDDNLKPHYGDMDQLYVNSIRQATQRMTQMTTDILSLERLHEHRDVTLTRVQLGTLLEYTVAEYREESRRRGQEISVTTEPLSVFGDSAELHEALANLIGNAIKYTPSGGTGKIEARLCRDEDSVLLEIIDNGCGIPADQQDQLFQPFHRVKTRETYTIDGTGLGLYLVKRIVERHKGSVHFESVYGKGSRFGFRLPLAKSSE